MSRPPHQLIYTHGGGRLGNQVLRFAHWMAWALEHPGEVEILNLSFWPQAEYFAEWREHPACVFPARANGLDPVARLRRAFPEWITRRLDWRVQRAVHARGRNRPGWQAVTLDDVAAESIDLAGPDFLARVKRQRVTTCAGWKIAGWDLLAKHQAAVRGHFRVAEPHAASARVFIAALRERHDLVIGVLVRQSDYREWDDGRFYFSTELYAGWIRQLVDLHPGRRVAVVIASEEEQDVRLFKDLPVHLATGNPGTGGHWFDKWVELSLCDLVLTPPSTFSATAAFVGQVPLWPLVKADQTLALDQIIPDGMIGAARHLVFSRAVK